MESPPTASLGMRVVLQKATHGTAAQPKPPSTRLLSHLPTAPRKSRTSRSPAHEDDATGNREDSPRNLRPLRCSVCCVHRWPRGPRLALCRLPSRMAVPLGLLWPLRGLLDAPSRLPANSSRCGNSTSSTSSTSFAWAWGFDCCFCGTHSAHIRCRPWHKAHWLWSLLKTS